MSGAHISIIFASLDRIRSFGLASLLEGGRIGRINCQMSFCLAVLLVEGREGFYGNVFLTAAVYGDYDEDVRFAIY